MSVESVPPHDLEAEQSVLGAILIAEDASEVLDRVSGILRPDDFYREPHRKIYQAMLDLQAARKPIGDVMVLKSQLGSSLRSLGFPAPEDISRYLGDLAALVPTTLNAETYATIIFEKSVLRDARSAFGQLAADVDEVRDVPEYLATVEYETARVLSRQLSKPSPSKATVLAEALWKVEHGRSDSVPTGFDSLDRYFGGFNPGHISILAARTSRGKTAFGLDIGLKAAQAGFQTAFVSLEQTREEMYMRAIGRLALVDFFTVRERGYRDDEKDKAEKARAALESVPLEILYRPSLRPRELRIECRRLLHEMGGLKLLILDYFNRMRGDRREKDRWREMGEVLLALQEISGDLGIPILLLWQLNREVDDRQPPSLAHLRDTGSGEEHASNVLFIWQPPPKQPGDGNGSVTVAPELQHEPKVDIIIAKQRNGPAGVHVSMRFFKRYGEFVEI